MATPQEILEDLKQIKYPGYSRDIVSFGLVRDIEIASNGITVTLAIGSAKADAVDEISRAVRDRVRALTGTGNIEVVIQEPEKPKPAAPAKAPGIPGVQHVVAVASGKGGVGKSTVAVNLACALQRAGARVGVLDADVYGPNVPLMLGVRGQPAVVDKKIVPFESHGLQVMSMALLVADDQPVIWRGPMLHSAMRQFLFDVSWRDLDYLIVDLPPGTGDAQLSLSQQAHLMGAVIVTTPQDVSVLDVKKAIRMFQTVNVPILGVVENMAWFSPPGSTERYYLFGQGGGLKIEREFGVPLLGQVPIEIAVREGGDRGNPITVAAPDSLSAVALFEIAGKIAQRVSILNAE